MLKGLIIRFFGAVLLGYCLLTSGNTVTEWKLLAPGLSYTQLNVHNSVKIHAFRIDLSRYLISSLTADRIKQTALSVNQLGDDKDVLIAINGGFFNPQKKPLGLRIDHGQIYTPIRKIPWWDVFLIKNDRAEIIPNDKFSYSPDISFAIQAGPRLIIDHRIPRLKAGLAERSAIGIHRDGSIILAISDHSPVSTDEMAQIMEKDENLGGLSCVNALNLDGGSSSQLFAKIADFSLKIHGIRLVSDVILVKQH